MSGGLEDLHRRIRADTACPLLRERTQAVPGEGPATARVMFIGEAPGAQEDRQGRPLVGSAGRAFDRLLEEAGLRREAVYITNAIKCRPPGNRAPRAPELEHCRGFLVEALEIIRPAVVCPMGAAALALVLGKKESIARLHGQALRQERFICFPLYHPAAAFYREDLRPVLKEDFRRLGELLRDEGLLP